LESIPDPVIGCDARGHVVYWSKAAREAYGFAAEEALGRPVVSLLQTRFPIPLLEIMEEVTDLGRWNGQLVHRDKRGREHTVESRWVARYDEVGKLVGGFGIERKLDELIAAGQRVALGGEIENLLVPGRYSIDCWIRRDRSSGDMVVQGLRLTHFVVYGTAPRHGMVSLPTTVQPRSLPLGGS
jgi:PAS domain S-box-containing protein